MPQGKLQVLLVSAKGLDNSDFLSSMDPYVLLTLRSQEQKSSVSTDNGSIPEWNETFVFTVSGEASELSLKIMDKDTFTADDFVGEANIPLEGVFEEGSLPPTSYTVVKDGEFKGEIKVGLTFIKEVTLVNIKLRKLVGGENLHSNVKAILSRIDTSSFNIPEVA